MDVYKTLYCFYITKKMPHESALSICIYFEIFFLVELYTNVPQKCTFHHPLRILLI